MKSSSTIYDCNCICNGPTASLKTTYDSQNSLATLRSICYGNVVVKLFLLKFNGFLAVVPGILLRIAKVEHKVGLFTKYQVCATVVSSPCILFSVILFELVAPVFTPLLSGTEFELRTLSSLEANFEYSARETCILTLSGLQLIHLHSLLCPTVETTGDSRNYIVLLVAIRRNQCNVVNMINSGTRVVLPTLYINNHDTRLDILDIHLSTIITGEQVSSTADQFCIWAKLVIPVEQITTVQLNRLSLYTTIFCFCTGRIVPRNDIPTFETCYFYEVKQFSVICVIRPSCISTIKNDTITYAFIVDTHRVSAGCIRCQISIRRNHLTTCEHSNANKSSCY